MRAIVLGGVLVACSGPQSTPEPPAPPTAASPELTPALAPLAWLLGDWQAEHSQVHWVAAGGTLYRIGMNGDGAWGVWMIDDGDGESATADGVLRCIVINTADGEVTAPVTASAAGRVEFAGTARGMAMTIELRRDGDAMIERVAADAGGGERADEPDRYVRGPAAPAAAAEAADRAFDADTAARGVDGWVAAFAPGGSMWRGESFAGAEAIAKKIEPTVTKGHLRWHPIASGVLNDNGSFTVGTATWTANAATEPGWRGSYVTIWGKQPDGSWKVVFDTGRGAQPAK